MSALENVVLVSAAVWMGALSLGLILAIRQIGLLTLRYELAEKARDMDGLSIGSSVPTDVLGILPDSGQDRSYVLILEADCGPCRELVEGLHDQRIDRPVVALIAGDRVRAEAVASRLPRSFTVVCGEAAGVGMASLDLSTTPFLFIINDRVIAGKNGPRSAEHFRMLLDEDEGSAGHDGRQLLEVAYVE